MVMLLTISCTPKAIPHFIGIVKTPKAKANPTRNKELIKRYESILDIIRSLNESLKKKN